MLKKIRSKLPKFLAKALLGLRKVVRSVALAGLGAAIALNLLLPLNDRLNQAAESSQIYSLIILSALGPILVPVDQVIVQNVEHKADGSICFNQPGETKRGCVKASQYFLKPMNVK